ncbi:hypothetical protein BIW11_06221 [Tropilaelaps mercedesae]|uniref:N-alpha-acetyltransferase 60 n=1 Tax=Tropilaelaps mercedesae TaxID=418985 RepID=A0A1V9XZ57_9ACAR|nr:hypothetical protein BIW11_06221 [Tropilaelaps mercedesae]
MSEAESKGTTQSEKQLKNSEIWYKTVEHADVESLFVLANSVLPMFYPRFFFRRIIDSPTGTAIGAFNKDQRLVGFILGDFDQVFIPKALGKLNLNPRKAFCVMLVGVEKAFQSLGIGSQLIRLITDPAHCPSISQSEFAFLHVMVEHIRAIRVYERLGFKRMVVWPKYYALNPPRDAFIMYKVIKADEGVPKVAESMSETVE